MPTNNLLLRILEMSVLESIIVCLYAAILLIDSQVYCYNRILPRYRDQIQHLHSSTIRNSNFRIYHHAEILIGSRKGIIPFLPKFDARVRVRVTMLDIG